MRLYLVSYTSDITYLKREDIIDICTSRKEALQSKQGTKGAHLLKIYIDKEDLVRFIFHSFGALNGHYVTLPIHVLEVI